MAEAIACNYSSENNCPFCNKLFDDEYKLKSHLVDMHDVKLKYTSEKQCEADFDDRSVCIGMPEIKKKSFVARLLNELKSVLKENFGLYMQQMKLWIHCDITKFQFYENVVSLFTPDTIIMHHQFLKIFLIEVQLLSEKSKSIEMDSFTYTTRNLTSIDPLPSTSSPNANYATENINLNVSSCSALIDSYEQQTISRYTMPDEETLFALSIISAWENGCTNIDKRHIPIVYSAVEHVVKNISKVIALRRKCIKVKPNGLVYDLEKVDPKDISPDDKPKYSGIVTLPELLDALEAHPGLIPLKSIYNITIQTILKSLEVQKAKYLAAKSEKEDH